MLSGIHKFERSPRAARACTGCHARKVRCDLTTSTTQCTNCVRDGQRCEPYIRQRRFNKITRPTAYERVRDASGSVPLESEYTPTIDPSTGTRHQSGQPQAAQHHGAELSGRATDSSDGPPMEPTSAAAASIPSASHGSGHMKRYSYLAPDKFAAQERSEIQYAAEPASQSTSRVLDLQQALEMPSRRAVRESLIESFWTYCYPWDPTVEKAELVGSPPERLSPLLLQAVFLAGSRASSALTTIATPEGYYSRAKTLFYLNQEEDPLTLIKAVSLLHWYNPHGPERISTDTATFWCRTAVNLAQQMGLHHNQRRVQDESLRRRVWWSLVVR